MGVSAEKSRNQLYRSEESGKYLQIHYINCILRLSIGNRELMKYFLVLGFFSMREVDKTKFVQKKL